MANTETFYKGLMASEDVQSYVGSCKFKNGDNYAIVSDGALVELDGLADNPVYGNTALDYNVYNAKAPSANNASVVIVDLSEVSQGVIAGNNYKIGAKLVGLQCKAGFPSRYRVPVKHDRYWVSGDCFTAEPSVGNFAVAAANTTKHTPAILSDVETGQYCVKIQDSRDFTVGAGLAGSGSTGKLYLCEVL